MNATNPFANMDFSKMMESYKLPGVDMDALMAAQKKNMDAITKANQTAYEGAQAVGKRQVEILQKTMEELQSLSKSALEGGEPQDKLQKQADVVKTALETAIKNMREIAELMSKSNQDAFEHINKRVAEAMEEIQGVMKKAGK
ncbi:MAG: phasin family protein [Pseudomonadota bacterium]